MMVVRAWAGEYNRRLTFWRNLSSRTANTDGEREESEERFCQRWGALEPVRATERFLSQQTKTDVTHRVRIRRDETTKQITADYWITLPDGTRYEIKGVFDREDARQELELECLQRL